MYFMKISCHIHKLWQCIYCSHFLDLVHMMCACVWYHCYTWAIIIFLQDDVVTGSLTVRENLHFSAALRLPSHMTRAQRKERVDRVIEELGLKSCSEQKVPLQLGYYTCTCTCTSSGHSVLCIQHAVVHVHVCTCTLCACVYNKGKLVLKQYSCTQTEGRTTQYWLVHQEFSIGIDLTESLHKLDG